MLSSRARRARALRARNDVVSLTLDASRVPVPPINSVVPVPRVVTPVRPTPYFVGHHMNLDGWINTRDFR